MRKVNKIYKELSLATRLELLRKYITYIPVTPQQNLEVVILQEQNPLRGEKRIPAVDSKKFRKYVVSSAKIFKKKNAKIQNVNDGYFSAEEIAKIYKRGYIVVRYGLEKSKMIENRFQIKNMNNKISVYSVVKNKDGKFYACPIYNI